jgi:hypothetical protein
MECRKSRYRSEVPLYREGRLTTERRSFTRNFFSRMADNKTVPEQDRMPLRMLGRILRISCAIVDAFAFTRKLVPSFSRHSRIAQTCLQVVSYRFFLPFLQKPKSSRY